MSDTTPEKYVQQEWGKNCVMFALSKVLSVSTFELAKRIVDNNIGGVTMIKQMENGSVIKKVLHDLGFVSLLEGGGKWSAIRPTILGYGRVTKGSETRDQQAKFYAVFWRKKSKEDWTDKDVAPGSSDHAFTIFISGTTISIPPTNDRDFDKSHNPLKDDDFVSVFRPPA